MKKKILHYYIKGVSDGGSDYSLFTHLLNLKSNEFEHIVIVRNNSPLVKKVSELGFKTIYFPTKNVLIPNFNKSNAANVDVKTKKESELKKFLRTVKLIINALPEAFKLRKIIKDNNIDLLHLNHNLNGDRPGIVAGILTRKKIISHNRGLHKPIQVDLLLSKFVSKIICISNYVKKEYVSNGIASEKCITIYNGVDIETFNSTYSDFKNPIIGCVGRLEEWKGQQVLINAIPDIVKVIPNVKVQFLGSGSNNEKLIELVKKLNIQNSVEFLGSVTNVSNYIKKFTIAVHTSIEPEPFGRVIIEAMAMNKPVISTNIGGPKEIIENNVDGFLIEPNNPKALSDKILDLLSNKILIDKIGKNARKKVVSSFDSKITSNNIESVYKEFLS